MDNQIALMAGKIGDLTTKIKEASAELAQANVGKVIGDLIKVGVFCLILDFGPLIPFFAVKVSFQGWLG